MEWKIFTSVLMTLPESVCEENNTKREFPLDAGMERN